MTPGPAALLLALALPASQIDTLALRAHTFFLSQDLLEGRFTGTRGENLAAAYIVAELKRVGAKGIAAGGGFRQPLPLREVALLPSTELRIRRGGATATFAPDSDFVLLRGTPEAYRPASGPALFAGPAEGAEGVLRELDDLSGRVVVLIGTLGRSGAVPELLAERGASGLLLVLPDRDGFERYAAALRGPRLALSIAVREAVWQPPLPVLVGGPAVARALFAGGVPRPSGSSERGSRPGRRESDLEAYVDFDLAMTTREVHAANIVAVLPGIDPTLRDEYVVYTAHYDHLGVRPPVRPGGDSIFNGFSDNAAGVAMVLEIAAELARDRPSRSTLFLFTTGEEVGLLGSSYYVHAPVVPLERTRAVINLDGGAPPALPLSWRLAGGDASPLGDLAREALAGSGYRLEADAGSPSSDHWPFLRRGVPALMLVPGRDWENLSEQEEAALFERWDRYHRAEDEWRPDFSFQGLARYAGVALAIGRAAAEP